jgi:hypothetical protein
MDIIAAHQQGLIEQLDEDVRALSGRPRDHAQRAVVLHHLFDHSRGGHEWALGEARRELRIARALAALDKRLDRWGWLIRNREAARAALDKLGDAIGNASQARCAAAYRAYRFSAAPALRGEAEGLVPAPLLDALLQCHAARRAGDPAGEELRRELRTCSEQLAAAATDHEALAAAWSAVELTGLKRMARRLAGVRALERGTVRDGKRGWHRIDRLVRNDPLLPASFRANPAQHFYALQHALAERRRQRWREACDREPGAFELAA